MARTHFVTWDAKTAKYILPSTSLNSSYGYNVIQRKDARIVKPDSGESFHVHSPAAPCHFLINTHYDCDSQWCVSELLNINITDAIAIAASLQVRHNAMQWFRSYEHQFYSHCDTYMACKYKFKLHVSIAITRTHQNSYCFDSMTIFTEVLVDGQPNLKMTAVRWQSEKVFESSYLDIVGWGGGFRGSLSGEQR